jgi:carbon starvation protein
LINPVTYNAFLLFVLFTLVYVLIVFTDMTASTFAPPSAEKALASMTEEGAKLSNLEGGTVATASLIYIGLALLFGVCIYRFKMRVSVGTLIFVPLVFLSLGAGHMAPLLPTDMPHLWGSAKNFWIVILLIYCFFASVLPVWLLLQPRDYLSSYLLYASLLGGTVGLIAAGTTGHALITYPAFTGFDNARLGSLYPFLFITIACGAVSGFHSVVASGTTAKQLDNEHSARRIGYGSMLVEGVLAVLALTTVMVLPAGVKTGTPVETFAKGLGSFLQVLGLKPELGVTFGMMAVSTFLLTTLDACTRLTRFILQELFGIPNSLAGRFLSTAIVLSLPALVVFQEITDATGNKVSAWQAIWPAFGASNQLLAALALLVIYVWMRRTGRRTIFVLIPMLFMCVTTLVALATLAVRNLAPGKNLFVGGLCSALFVLALTVIASTVWSLRKSAPAIPAEKTGD